MPHCGGYITEEYYKNRKTIIEGVKEALKARKGKVAVDMDFIKSIYDIKYNPAYLERYHVYNVTDKIQGDLFVEAIGKMQELGLIVFASTGLEDFDFTPVLDKMDDVLLAEFSTPMETLERLGRNRFNKDSLERNKIPNMLSCYGEKLGYSLLGMVALLENHAIRLKLGELERYEDKIRFIRDIYLGEQLFSDSDDLLACLGLESLATVTAEEDKTKTSSYELENIGLAKYIRAIGPLKGIYSKVKYDRENQEYTASEQLQTEENMGVIVDALNNGFVGYVEFMKRHSDVFRWANGKDDSYSIEVSQPENLEAITWVEYIANAPAIGKGLFGVARGRRESVIPGQIIDSKIEKGEPTITKATVFTKVQS